MLSGREEAQAVGTPRAAALRSCIRPLLGKLPPIIETGELTNANAIAEEHVLSAAGEGSLVNSTAISQERVQAHSTQSGGLQLRGGVLHSSRGIMRKLANQVNNSSGRRVEGKNGSGNLGWQAADQGQIVGLERGFAALIARPPLEVSALVRAIVAERGKGGALRRALGPSHYKVRIGIWRNDGLVKETLLWGMDVTSFTDGYQCSTKKSEYWDGLEDLAAGGVERELLLGGFRGVRGGRTLTLLDCRV